MLEACFCASAGDGMQEPPNKTGGLKWWQLEAFNATSCKSQAEFNRSIQSLAVPLRYVVGREMKACAPVFYYDYSAPLTVYWPLLRDLRARRRCGIARCSWVFLGLLRRAARTLSHPPASSLSLAHSSRRCPSSSRQPQLLRRATLRTASRAKSSCYTEPSPP